MRVLAVEQKAVCVVDTAVREHLPVAKIALGAVEIAAAAAGAGGGVTAVGAGRIMAFPAVVRRAVVSRGGRRSNGVVALLLAAADE